MEGRSTGKFTSWFRAPTLALLLMLSSCGDEVPELSVEDQLESLAGQQLTPAEIQRQLEVADTLCQTNSQILERIWMSSSAQQLRFQDFVFGTRCPERSVEYAAVTGRSLTVDAHDLLTQPAVDTTGGATTGQTLPLPDSLTSTTQP